MLNKQQIRQSMLLLRRHLDPAIQRAAAQQLNEQVSQTQLFKKSQRIAFYLPLNAELDPRLLLAQAWEQGKHCFLPTLAPTPRLESTGQMAFFSYKKLDGLIKNRYGILQPQVHEQESCLAQNLELVLVPLVAFDQQCNRLGMGGGYYDKSFAFLKNYQKRENQQKNRPYLLGLAYGFQRCASIPIEPWDLCLDEVWVFKD